MASTSTAVETAVADKKVKKTAKVPARLPEKADVVGEFDISTNNNVNEVASLKVLVEELSNRVAKLEAILERIEKTKTDTEVVEKPKKEEKEKKPRAPTAYNNFMKEKMHELKESHPSLTNIERMKMAAEAWTESKK